MQVDTHFSHTLLTLGPHIHTLHFAIVFFFFFFFLFFFPELFLESPQLELCKAPRNRQCCPSSSFWPSRMTALTRRMPFRSTMSIRGSSNKSKSWSSLMNTRKRTGKEWSARLRVFDRKGNNIQSSQFGTVQELVSFSSLVVRSLKFKRTQVHKETVHTFDMLLLTR